jgi:hypothetical protein
LRVHRAILRGEGVPDPPRHNESLWHERYRSIKNVERHLHVNGTRTIKFFLHLSKDEQRKRFLARIEEPLSTTRSFKALKSQPVTRRTILGHRSGRADHRVPGAALGAMKRSRSRLRGHLCHK